MASGPKKKASFQKFVWDYYRANQRDSLPWRQPSRGARAPQGKKFDPYRIWISEIMLQQTQVDRVVGFFNDWMKKFPTIASLAEASQIDVLKHWKGLGYNSRAVRIKKTAETIVEKHKGIFPKTCEEILDLPGIGPYTAGAIMAFAYNQPVTMIETNIRRVYLHHFFSSSLSTTVERTVHDKDLLKLIQETSDKENSREWYWALMDYGSYLGKTIPNPNKKSRHYTVQKQFKGSDREIRGKILESLLEKNKISFEKLFKSLDSLSTDHDRIETIVDRMGKEGFLELKNDTIFLKK